MNRFGLAALALSASFLTVSAAQASDRYWTVLRSEAMCDVGNSGNAGGNGNGNAGGNGNGNIELDT